MPGALKQRTRSGCYAMGIIVYFSVVLFGGIAILVYVLSTKSYDVPDDKGAKNSIRISFDKFKSLYNASPKGWSIFFNSYPFYEIHTEDIMDLMENGLYLNAKQHGATNRIYVDFCKRDIRRYYKWREEMMKRKADVEHANLEQAFYDILLHDIETAKQKNEEWIAAKTEEINAEGHWEFITEIDWTNGKKAKMYQYK